MEDYKSIQAAFITCQIIIFIFSFVDVIIYFDLHYAMLVDLSNSIPRTIKPETGVFFNLVTGIVLSWLIRVGAVLASLYHKRRYLLVYAIVMAVMSPWYIILSRGNRELNEIIFLVTVISCILAGLQLVMIGRKMHLEPAMALQSPSLRVSGKLSSDKTPAYD